MLVTKLGWKLSISQLHNSGWLPSMSHDRPPGPGSFHALENLLSPAGHNTASAWWLPNLKQVTGV